MNGNLIIKNAAELVTCSGFKAKKGKEMADLHIINDGAVIIKEGVIEAAGKTADSERFQRITCCRHPTKALKTWPPPV